MHCVTSSTRSHFYSLLLRDYTLCCNTANELSWLFSISKGYVVQSEPVLLNYKLIWLYPNEPVYLIYRSIAAILKLVLINLWWWNFQCPQGQPSNAAIHLPRANCVYIQGREDAYNENFNPRLGPENFFSSHGVGHCRGFLEIGTE